MGYVERGAKNPTIKTVEKLAIALGCKVSELFEDIAEGEEKSITTLPRGRKTK